MMYHPMTTFERSIPADLVPAASAPETGSDATAGRRAARRAALPEIAPDTTAPRTKPRAVPALETAGIQFTAASIVDESTDFRERVEANSLAARLTVYAMNATVMVFAFPVGFGLLIFNILGGENLRTTAHAMALTGMAIALSMTEVGQQIITSI